MVRGVLLLAAAAWGCGDTTVAPSDAGSVGSGGSTGTAATGASSTSGVGATGAASSGSGLCPADLCGGICVDTSTDPLHCGQCDLVCPTGTICEAGECSCPGALIRCRETCVDAAHDVDHCGDCGIACGAGQLCLAGQCACPEPFVPCDGGCVDPTIDPSHCGGCNVGCAQGQPCSDGLCGCGGGWFVCDGNCVDIQVDPDHCGDCQSPCDIAAGMTCMAGVCSGPCPWGFGDCDGDGSNGCEIHLASDASNCGACGHACNGSLCAAGKCEPIVLATNQGNAMDVKTDDVFVYWTYNNGPDSGVRRTPVGGGAVESLATAQVTPTWMAIDSSHVYWTDYNADTVSRVAKGGGPTEIIADVPGANRVASDGTHAYFTGSGVVGRVAVAGGILQQLASETYPSGIDVDATHVYFTTDTTVQKVAKGGGVATILVQGFSDPRQVVAHGSSLYFIVYNECEVWTVLKTGGPPSLLGKAGGACMSIDADSVHAYTAGFGVYRHALSGGYPEILFDTGGFGIAVGAAHVFVSGSPDLLQISK